MSADKLLPEFYTIEPLPFCKFQLTSGDKKLTTITIGCEPRARAIFQLVKDANLGRLAQSLGLDAEGLAAKIALAEVVLNVLPSCDQKQLEHILVERWHEDRCSCSDCDGPDPECQDCKGTGWGEFTDEILIAAAKPTPPKDR